jgi:hypothetical protein
VRIRKNKIKTMSKIALKLFVAATLMVGYSSCKTFKDLSKQKDGDDVYYSMKDAKKERAAEKKRKEEEEKRKAEEAKQQQAKDNNAKALATSPGTNYYDQPFDYDDYYDYEYAARLRRFSDPTPGAGYYDNYYTNSYYYNQNPYLYGTSVYNSYGFWGPSAYAYNYCPSSYFYYNSGWAWGTGMYYGNPYSSPYGMGYYDPWANQGWGYSPYYSYNPGWNNCGGYGYNPYGYNPYGYGNNGYGNNGYGNNYGSGNNNYYYNSYDENSDYYGPRHSASASDGRVPGSGGPAFGERYAEAVAAENGMQDANIHDINRITRDNYAAGTTTIATPVDTRDKGVNTVPAPPVNTNPNTSVSRDPGTSGNGNNTTEQRDNTPPPPVFTTTPVQTQQQQQQHTDTPPLAPDYNRPAPVNTQQPAPEPVQRPRDNGNSSGNSGGNNSGNAPAPAPAPRNTNSGGTANRPR